MTGGFRFGHPLVKPENPDPPDLARSPKPPYLKDVVHRPVAMFVGLANDELGYLVPEYDFKVRKNLLMWPRLPGDITRRRIRWGPPQRALSWMRPRTYCLKKVVRFNPMPIRDNAVSAALRLEQAKELLDEGSFVKALTVLKKPLPKEFRPEGEMLKAECLRGRGYLAAAASLYRGLWTS